MPYSATKLIAAIVIALVALFPGSSAIAAPTVPEMLTNPGFESPYAPVRPSTGNAQITGSVAGAGATTPRGPM